MLNYFVIDFPYKEEAHYRIVPLRTLKLIIYTYRKTIFEGPIPHSLLAM